MKAIKPETRALSIRGFTNYPLGKNPSSLGVGRKKKNPVNKASTGLVKTKISANIPQDRT